MTEGVPPTVRFRRDLGVTLAGQLTVLLVGLGAGAVTARLLGPAGRGELALAMLVPAVLALLCGAGTALANTYFAGRGTEPTALARNSFTWSLVGGGAGAAVAAVAVALGAGSVVAPGVDRADLALALVAVPLLLLAAQWSALLRGLQLQGAASLVAVVQAVVVGGLTVALLLAAARAGVRHALLGYLGGLVVTAAAAAWLLRRQGVRVRPGWDPALARSTTRFGLRGEAGNLLQLLNYRLDLVLVSGFLGAGSAGTYFVAGRVAELLWILPSAVAMVVFPRTAGASREVRDTALPRVFWATASATVAAALVLASVAEPLLVLLFSREFAAAYLPLLALMPGVVFVGLSSVLSSELSGRGRPGLNSLNSFAALVITVLLDLLLIPRFGVVGAAAASSVAYTLNLALALLFYLRVSETAAADFLRAARWWRVPAPRGLPPTT